MPKPWKTAHRGRHDLHLENTLEAFRAAYQAGCDMVEFDVQLSRDGVPVIFHDDDCRRLAGRPDAVYALDWETLGRMRMPSRRAEYRIPSLEEFLAEFAARPYYLELKIPAAREKDEAYIHALGAKTSELVRASNPHGRTFLASFHGGMLRYLRREKLFPTLGGIFEDYDRFREVHSARDAETHAAIRYYSLSWKLYRRFLKDRADKGAAGPGPDRFLVWNIAPPDFPAAIDSGVRGLVADDVEALAHL